jgi:hypothetical protein
MKQILFSLFCLTLMNACGQLTPEQWAQLNGNSGGSSDNRQTSKITSMQTDYRSSVDLLYFTNYIETSRTYGFTVTRANGILTSKAVTLNASDSPALFQFLQDLYSGKISIVSRATCTDCIGSSSISITRADASMVLYQFPQVSSASTPSPLDELNRYILNHL